MAKSKGYSLIYRSETEKIKPRLVKYIKEVGEENIIDVGCGHDKITKVALGVDSRPLEGVDHVCKGHDDICNLDSIFPDRVGRLGMVYSSHMIEHIVDYDKVLLSWHKMIRQEGYLILYLPCDTMYDNDSNPEHVHRFTRESFLEKNKWMNDHYDLIESFDDYGDDKYSFCLVYRKK